MGQSLHYQLDRSKSVLWGQLSFMRRWSYRLNPPCITPYASPFESGYCRGAYAASGLTIAPQHYTLHQSPSLPAGWLCRSGIMPLQSVLDGYLVRAGRQTNSRQKQIRHRRVRETLLIGHGYPYVRCHQCCFPCCRLRHYSHLARCRSVNLPILYASPRQSNVHLPHYSRMQQRQEPPAFCQAELCSYGQRVHPHW